jgi:hypothetical protein
LYLHIKSTTMKQKILNAALHLMSVNGQTTTLEVKNYLHDQYSTDPTFELRQAEVSKTMRELAGENNWVKSPSTQGYIIYSDPNIQQQAAPLTLGYTVPASSAGGSVTAVPPLTYPTAGIAAYVRSNPKLHVIGLSRKEARTRAYKLFRSEAGDYNNINTCLANFYLTKKVK